MATGAPPDPAVATAALQEIYNLVVNPNQTPEQVGQGELNFVQLREQVRTLIRGDQQAGTPGIESVVQQNLQVLQQMSQTTGDCVK